MTNVRSTVKKVVNPDIQMKFPWCFPKLWLNKPVEEQRFWLGALTVQKFLRLVLL